MVNKDEKAKARREQENQNDKHAPASDIYSKVEGKDPETGVEIPTDEAVKESVVSVNENAK